MATTFVPAAAADSSARKPVLLVVDDEEGPRTSLKVVFLRDFKVITASNGRDALQLARETPVDVAILDILMPGMSGVDVLRELKALDEDIEVIMLTAFETLETARQALRLGAREYLNKPFDIPALRAAAASAIERRAANRDLRSAQGRLGDLRNELKDEHEKLEMDRTRTAVYGSVLHDLNSPLTVINGFIELLHRQVESASKLEGGELEKMKSGITRIHTQVTRCLEISRRYLGLLRSGGAEEYHSVSVNQVLADLRELLEKHPSCDGNELIVRELDEDATARVHGTDILQILLNLTINGLQSTAEPHRVEVVASMISPQFDPAKFDGTPGARFVPSPDFDRDTAVVAISVRDNGPGMTPELLAKIFNEQFTTKPLGKGTGLGTGIVKRLVFQSRGAILLTSSPGAGAKFSIFLPAR